MKDYVNIEVPGTLVFGYEDLVLGINNKTLTIVSATFRGYASIFDEDGPGGHYIVREMIPDDTTRGDDVTPLFRAAAKADAITFNADAKEVRITFSYERFWEPGFVDHHRHPNDPDNASTEPCAIGKRRFYVESGRTNAVLLKDEGFVAHAMDYLEGEIHDALSDDDPSGIPWLLT